jgi:hypothetical protein
MPYPACRVDGRGWAHGDLAKFPQIRMVVVQNSLDMTVFDSDAALLQGQAALKVMWLHCYIITVKMIVLPWHGSGIEAVVRQWWRWQYVCVSGARNLLVSHGSILQQLR